MSYKPPYTITSKIVELISKISENIGQLEVLEFKVSHSRLRKISKIKTITGTLQIEGNTLTEKQITAILNGKRVLGSVKEVAEAKGAIELYNRLERFDYKNQDHLLESHKVLMDDVLKNAGAFRHQNVGVGGQNSVVHIAPPKENVPELMMDLFKWLKKTKEHPLIVSSVFHYEFEFIHPFIDGNGRMGRFWQSLVLFHWKPFFSYVPIESIVRDRQIEYYNALEQCGQAGESTLFIEYMLDSILEAMNQLADSDQVTDQVTDQVKKLINVMGIRWLSSNEIMAKLGLSHKPTFRKNYLNPALESGLIEMSNPGSPRSPQQKYKVKRKSGL
ncbi:MAG: Fic family protein [Candidatus Marinimicrobia bacterium]|nr:Fic family protein [Candidatus Neomarinimicrobiota bacterium]